MTARGGRPLNSAVVCLLINNDFLINKVAPRWLKAMKLASGMTRSGKPELCPIFASPGSVVPSIIGAFCP